MTPLTPSEAGIVAVVAPGGRDAVVINGILRSAGVGCSVETVPMLLAGIPTARFDAALIAEEALTATPVSAVVDAVDRQPPWSDFPFIVMSRRGRSTPTSPILEAMRNVTEVERPVHPATLLGTVRSAMRARERQHETAAHLAARQAAEESYRALAQTLESRVDERTRELSATNRRLQHEITERTEAESRLAAMHDQLIQVSRLSAMGTMGATIAHELNQPLAAILNYMRGAERLIGGMDDPPADLLTAVGAVAANAHRAGTIIRNLRNLVQQRPVERARESVHTLFEEAQVLGLIDSSSLGIACRLDIDPDVDCVLVERTQIQQVLINLIRNAVDAMDGCAQREIVLGAYRVAGERVCICVSDSGPGLPPDILSAAFTSFKSQKPEGPGIGLSICRTILEEYGATLSARNKEGGGAVVSFDLAEA